MTPLFDLNTQQPQQAPVGVMSEAPRQTQPQQPGQPSESPERPSEPSEGPANRPPTAIATALRILLPLGQPDRPAGSLAAVHWLVPGGLVIGLIYVGLYRASWRMFGEVGGVRLMPALVVWLADVGCLGLMMILAAARTVDRRPSINGPGSDRRGQSCAPAGTLAIVLLAILKLALWIAIPEGIAGWPTNWRRHLNFVYPWPVYRPLILAPIWGRWALILAAGVGGRAAADEPLPPGLSRSPSLAATLGWFAAATVLTAIYCGRYGRWMTGCIISLAVLGVTFLSAVLATRRFRGHTRCTVYAAGFVAEAVFLLSYLAFSQYIYRY